MGLNCTHGCYDGPYSYFNTFRKWVAKQIFIDMDQMEGFAKDIPGASWDCVIHPIKPLLDHSDCDGELTPDDCRSVIEGAQMILNRINPDSWGNFEIALKTFSNGCKKAIKNNETVYFR